MEQQRQKRKSVVLMTVVIAIVLTAAVVFFVYDASKKTNEHIGFAMGSEIVAVFYGSDKSEIADCVFSEISVLDTDLISRKSEKSEVCLLNENGSTELSDETVSYIEKALEICKDSYGALDITVGALSTLWDFDSSKNQVPDSASIEKALSYCGYEKVKIDNNTVKLGENQIIDMGAIGKGIACDTAKKVLSENNVDRALISVGGTVMTYSDGKDYAWHDGWGIAVRTPEIDDSAPLLRVNLTDTKVVSTSGNYEKYFEQDGMLYHHILDTETGYPADKGLKSVTIFADSGLVSDALSTACFVLGKDDSSSLLRKYNAEAIFVDNDNNVYITAGIYDSCTLLNEAYKVFRYE